MTGRAASGLKLYANIISPVCRSVVSFMKLNDIPYTMENVDVLKGNYIHFSSEIMLISLFID